MNNFLRFLLKVGGWCWDLHFIGSYAPSLDALDVTIISSRCKRIHPRFGMVVKYQTKRLKLVTGSSGSSLVSRVES